MSEADHKDLGSHSLLTPRRNEAVQSDEPGLMDSSILSFVHNSTVDDPIDYPAYEREKKEIEQTIFSSAKEKITTFSKKTFKEIQALIAEELVYRHVLTGTTNGDWQDIIADESQVNQDFRLVLEAGAETALIEVTNLKIKKLALEGSDEGTTLNKYVVFLYSEDVNVRFGEAHLYDLSLKNVTSVEAINLFLKSWKFLLDPHFSGSHSFEFTEFFKQGGELFNRYPNFSMKDVVKAALNTQALLDIDDSSYDNLSHLLPAVRLAGQHAKRLVNIVHDIEEKSFSILFQKTSHPEQTQILDCVSPYLAEDSNEVRTLRVLGILKDASHIKEAFRAATIRSHSGPYAHVYEQIASSIKKYLENTPETESLPVFATDVLAIVNQDTQTDGVPFSWGQLRDLTAKLYQKSPRGLKMTLDPDSPAITWGALTPPEKVTFTTDPKHQARSSVQLQWLDQESGETLTVTVFVDTKNEQLDWSILESPDDPTTKSLKNTFLQVLPSLFSQCYKQVSAKTTSSRPASDPVPATTKRVWVKDEIYALRKDARKQDRQQKNAQTENLPQSRDVALAFTKLISNNIILPDSVDDPRFGQLKSHYKKQVLETIITYDKDGKGRFKKLTHTPPDGIPRYALRVNTDGGEVRVICIKAGSHGKGDLFKIDKIYKRPDAYKKLYKGK